MSGIAIRSVSKRFGDVRAVDDVSLDVADGEFVTLLGPSGCGKTTLLRMIAGLENASEGTIAIGGEDVTDAPAHRRPVNMVFQDYALFPHMSVARNIAYGQELRGRPRTAIEARTREVLAMVDLVGREERRPSELSGGQRQRVALARALACDPKVLLLDEPMSALDAGLRGQMQVELKRLHERLGLTFVMVTHDQTEALVMSDRVVVMREGAVEQVGEPTELHDRPATPYVAGFVGTSNLLHGTLASRGDGRLIVSVGNRPVAAMPSTIPPVIGQATILSVRPGKIALGDGARDADTRIGGTVEDVLFHGEMARLIVATPLGEPLLVDRALAPGCSVTDLPRRGDAVELGFDARDALAFADASAPSAGLAA